MTSGNGAGFSGYDAVVIGAGPAGISAAISIANRKKKVLVLDGRRPFAKARRAPSIPNYPGFQFASGEELAAAFQDHLSRFDVPVLAEDYCVSFTYLPQYVGEYEMPEAVVVRPVMKPDRLIRRDGKIHVELGAETVEADAVFIYRAVSYTH